jgi:hypothetical protein
MESQSIELDREPYESEVRVEVRRREEENRTAAKKQKMISVVTEKNSEERFKRLEARMIEGEEELFYVKQELRTSLAELCGIGNAGNDGTGDGFQRTMMHTVMNEGDPEVHENSTVEVRDPAPKTVNTVVINLPDERGEGGPEDNHGIQVHE